MTTQQPRKGVNLGGWFIPEKWMTPALFGDSADLHQLVRTDGGVGAYVKHLDTWITEDDFVWLRKNQVEAVRIPVSYWILGGDDVLPDCMKKLDWAVSMAKKYGLQVVLDLHGAPGSQNGNDHSGKVGKAEWFSRREYRQQSIDFLVQLAKRYKKEPHIWGIELLNEPKVHGLRSALVLLQFHRRAYRALVEAARSGTRIIYSDAFLPLLFSNTIGRRHLDFPVLIDIHRYHFVYWLQGLPIDWFLRVLWWEKLRIWLIHRQQGIILGEWSGVVRGRTAQSLSPAALKKAEDALIEKIQANYNTAEATFYWSYKVGDGIWSYRWLKEQGRIS